MIEIVEPLSYNQTFVLKGYLPLYLVCMYV